MQLKVPILIWILIGLFVVYMVYVLLFIIFRPYFIEGYNWICQSWAYISIMYFSKFADEEKDYELAKKNLEVAENELNQVDKNIAIINEKRKKSKKS